MSGDQPSKVFFKKRYGTIGLLFRLRATGISREKRVVLVAALADVRDHKVLVRPDVHFISDLTVVGRIVGELAREDRVARVGHTRTVATRRLIPHRRSYLRPDAVRADEDVARDYIIVFELDV